MSYRIKRVDPYWFKSPAVGGTAVVFGAVALYGARTGSVPALALGAFVAAVMVILATKPALSAVFAAFGLLGGVLAFLAGSSAGMSPLLRLTATAGFGLFYAALMDIVVLGLSVIYNSFTGVGFKGLALDLEA